MSVGRRISTLSLLLTLVLCLGCTGAGRLSLRTSPYDQYVAMLERARLDKTNLQPELLRSGRFTLRRSDNGSASPAIGIEC
jgi:hypothetical protein